MKIIAVNFKLLLYATFKLLFHFAFQQYLLTLSLKSFNTPFALNTTLIFDMDYKS